MSKKTIYLLGLLTLLVFPILGILLLYFFKNQPIIAVFQIEKMVHPFTIFGLLIGLVFAKISLVIFNSAFFANELNQQMKLIASLNLTVFDKIFLSFCAGFGEEILFRSSIQSFLGIWITSVLFIAIHGYFNPKNGRISLYGLFLLPFILLLGYGLSWFGIWFCIAAHFSYDLLLFLSFRKEEEQVFFKKVKSK
jgi:uncharacterized protein